MKQIRASIGFVIGLVAALASIATLAAKPAQADEWIGWHSAVSSAGPYQFLSVLDGSLINGGKIVNWNWPPPGVDDDTFYQVSLSTNDVNEITALSANSRNTPFMCVEDHGFQPNVGADQWDCAYSDQNNEIFEITDRGTVIHPSIGWNLVNLGNGQCLRYVNNNTQAKYGTCGSGDGDEAARWIKD